MLIDAVSNKSNNNMFVFTSRVEPWPVENLPPAEDRSFKTTTIDPLYQLLFGNKVLGPDLSFVIKRIVWTSGVVYARYDHRDEKLFDKQFYVLTTANHVFKCIDNNDGKPSTIEPSLVQSTIFKTSDNYRWKYMYSLTSVANTRFGTVDYIPIVANVALSNSAVDGIDHIEVTTTGAGYSGSTSGKITSVVNTTVFQISSNSSIDNDYYNTSGFYITSGPASGALRTINDYIVNTSGRFVKVDSAISNVIALTTNYRIAPSVIIAGDGTGAQAVAIVNTSVISDSVFQFNVVSGGRGYANGEALVVANTGSNVAGGYIVTDANGTITSGIVTQSGSGFANSPKVTITTIGGSGGNVAAVIGGYPVIRIDVINPGSGYHHATASIVANSIFGVGATATPMISPTGGHGANAVFELGTHNLMISARYTYNSNAVHLLDTSYRTVGILLNPSDASNVSTLFAGNSFIQTLSLTTSPIVTWTEGNFVTGKTTGASGVVVGITNNNLVICGDQHFANTETIVNSNTGQTTTISAIVRSGDLYPGTGRVLYTNNIQANRRYADQAEIFKINIEY